MTLALLISWQIAAFYLVFTLAATGLAKAKSWRWASIGIMSERVVPRGFAVPVTVALVVVELLLAALIAIGVLPTIVDLLTAGLFALFGIYKIAVGLRRGVSGCSCAGVSMAHIATPSGAAANVLASLIQAAFGFLYASVSQAEGSLLTVLPALVLQRHLAVRVVGVGRDGGSGRSGPGVVVGVASSTS